MEDIVLVAIVAVGIGVLSHIRVLADGERYVAESHGNFERFVGPGLIFKPPFTPKWGLIRIGQIVDVSGGTVQVGGCKVPFVASGSLESKARIVEFLPGRVRVEPVT